MVQQTFVVLVDSDCHGDDYVTPIVNIIMSKQDFGSTYQKFLCCPFYIDFTETDWSAQQSFAPYTNNKQ